MARTVLVIHGAGDPRRRGGQVYWEPMLGSPLHPDYLVKAPHMPQPNNPRYRTWARRIAQLIASIPNPVLVGHSFGASVVLKYLAEVTRRPSLAGLFLIAMPFWGAESTEFALPPDFTVRRDLSGHEFNQPQFPELVADILDLGPERGA